MKLVSTSFCHGHVAKIKDGTENIVKISWFKNKKKEF